MCTLWLHRYIRINIFVSGACIYFPECRSKLAYIIISPYHSFISSCREQKNEIIFMFEFLVWIQTPIHFSIIIACSRRNAKYSWCYNTAITKSIYYLVVTMCIYIYVRTIFISDGRIHFQRESLRVLRK